MKRIAIIHGDLRHPTEKKALERLSELLLDYTAEYPMCFTAEPPDPTAFRRLYVGTKESNPYIRQKSTAALTTAEEYALSVAGDEAVIEGFDAAGVLYGCMDFYNRFLTKLEFPNEHLHHIPDPFAGEWPAFSLTSRPSVKQRGIWTWGHVIYDYRAFIDNMTKLKMNTVIIWNDFAPLNAREMVDYAHTCGIQVFFGFAWGWDVDFDNFSLQAVENSAADIVKTYEEQYADLGADGLYFQSFTEVNTEYLGGVLIAEAVTDFVNRTAGRLLEKHPQLELQFGLHANSVKNKLEFIQKVDKRIRIVWENCGGFPFFGFSCDESEPAETAKRIERLAHLRGDGEKFGAVTKSLVGLDWSAFFHADAPVYIGKGSKAFLENRAVRKRKMWKLAQANWLAHADKAYQTVQTLCDATDGDLVLAALVEDGVFERDILYPVALYAEMLWDSHGDLSDMIRQVALRSYVDFA